MDDHYEVLRDAQTGFARFDLYFLRDHLLAVETVSSRGVILGSVFGFIGMMLWASSSQAKNRRRAEKAIARGTLEDIAKFKIDYEQIEQAQVQRGYFTCALVLKIADGRRRKFTFATDEASKVSGVVQATFGSKAVV